MSWQVDKNHTTIAFSVRHMMVATVRGLFEDYDIVANFDETNLANSTAEVRIKAASINTRAQDRDNHLRSPDFFDVENYPEIVFKSTKVEVTGPNTGKLYGELTIRDVTRPIVLNVEHGGIQKSPFGDGYKAGFSAATKINRKDWGLNWNVAIEAGGVLVGEEIKLEIEVELLKQTEPILRTTATA
jgi:polyisoprenoid-binding protein YceI